MLYYTLKTVHIIAFTSWMAGMFYLPRLFVYHTQVATGSEADMLFQAMERKLLKYIMTPAMLLTWIAGLWLAGITQAFAEGWFAAKMVCVLGMSAAHGLFAMHRSRFASGSNNKPERYFRLINEIPTVLFIIIVALVIFKAF